GRTMRSPTSRRTASSVRGSLDSGETIARGWSAARSRTPARKSTLPRRAGAERFGHRRMHERADVAAVARNLADQARADVRGVERRHHEDGLEPGREMPVHERHLVLVLEVAHRAQPADQDAGAD